MVMLTYLCPSYDVHSPTLYCSDADSLPSLKHGRFGHIDDLALPSVKNKKKSPRAVLITMLLRTSTKLSCCFMQHVLT